MKFNIKVSTRIINHCSHFSHSSGEVIKITIEDYVQHLSQYKVKINYNPEVVHDTTHQWDNRIHVEFDHLYHWHPLVPDIIKVSHQRGYIT